jgi:pyruvate/2-oxoglutarate dehydrogenase complex dihydrolipoamide acyltransferase (E2) component
MQHEYVTLHVPQINANDLVVRLVEWKVADGTQVAQGAIVAVVESSKAANDVEAPAAGFIRHNATAGDDVNVGDALAFLAHTLESLPNRQPTAVALTSSVKATAKARQLAHDHGVDLATIKKTGIVTEQDVQNAIAQRDASSASANGAAASQAVPLSAVQASVRKAVEQSLAETAPAYLLGTADVTEATNQIEALTERDGVLVTVTDLLIYVVARVLPEYPRLNARLAGGNVEQYNGINIGVTVEANDDLYAVVIAGADKLTLPQIAEKRTGYVMQLFRGQGLSNEALRGGTFTVTVLTQPAVLHQVPIIFPEQAGIFGIGAAQDVLRREGREILTKKSLGISISYDHRFVNGNYAAKFMQAVATGLEHFRASS